MVQPVSRPQFLGCVSSLFLCRLPPATDHDSRPAAFTNRELLLALQNYYYRTSIGVSLQL